ncbi:MAG: HAD family hydrolase [Anaerolineales bacterium]|jgi:HAD superfamily hydrolase (TIGR01549 family)
MIKGALFDLGSTLIRFTGNWQQVFDDGMQEMISVLTQGELELDVEAFKNTFVETWQRTVKQRDEDHVERPIIELLYHVLEELGHAQLSSTLIEHAIERMFSVSESFWYPMSNVHTVLENLSAAGLRLGIVSNASNTANVQRLVDNAELRSYFDPIVVSAEQRVRKPNKRIFTPVLQTWGLRPQQIVMTGDNLAADVLGAKQLGMYSIWLTADANTPENEALRGTIVPDAVAERLDDVPEIIRGFNS